MKDRLEKQIMKIDNNRISHMHGVAEFMNKHAKDFGLDSNAMYILGLLHDIGYIHGKQNHEENGGEMMEQMNYPYSQIIKYHGTTPSVYMKKFRLTEEEIPKELILLWMADMSINLNGENVGYELRLQDIGTRLGFDSVAYANCMETVKFLMEFCKIKNCRK